MPSRVISINATPIEWDEEWYVSRYPDIATAIADGRIGDPLLHFLQFGLREGRFPSASAARKRWPPVEPELTSVGIKVSFGNFSIPLNWPTGGEVGKSFALRLTNGFFRRFLSGPVILDIGFRGASADAVPVLPHAVGVDLGYPGYDGIRLPFADSSVDAVFTSHVLEHVPDATAAIIDWFRVLRVGGHIVCIVPHQFLYERKQALPSQWSGEHRRFYTPASLVQEFESSLAPNSYRVRHLADNDLGYNYEVHPDHHASGCYEIELVIEKIVPPSWQLG